jgi:phosphonate transport system substrate-binding protein
MTFRDAASRTIPGTPTLVAAVLLLICLAWLPPAARAADTGAGGTERAPYILGVFPFIPAASIEGLFAPIAAELSAAVGRPVILRTTDSFDKFMAGLRRREYDLAFVQPFDYVDIARPKGYFPLARRSEDLVSVLVSRSESPLRTIKDLKGKRLGMPPETAAVSILNRIALKKAGLTPGTGVTVEYFSSHQACLQQLLVGHVDACGISPTGARLVENQMGVRFRELGRSPAIPHTLFVAHGRIPARERQAMTAVLGSTDLAKVPAEFRSLFVTEGQKPFRRVDDREYEPVRRHLRLLGRP